MFANLCEAKVRQLAKNIRKLLEPNGAKSFTTTSESEVRKLIYKYCNTQINGMSDILSILRTNYQERTIARLKSKIKKGVVWDTSICDIPTKQLLDVFYNNKDYVNIITSLTFHELLKLAKKGLSNAKILINCILTDTDSKYCVTVPMAKTYSYVDTQLIEYCVQNGYALYTRDKRLMLRARSHQIPTFSFSKFTSPYRYSANESGKNIILDESVFERSFENIIKDATVMGCGKFLITGDFVEYLENKEDCENIKKFIYFLLADENGDYSSYLPNCEIYDLKHSDETPHTPNDLIELAHKYNAIIFTADVERAFNLKSSFDTCFWYVSSHTDRKHIEQFSKILPDFSGLDILSKSFELKDYLDMDPSSVTTSTSDMTTDSDSEIESYSGKSSESDYSHITPLSTEDLEVKINEVNRFVSVVNSTVDDGIICKIPRFDVEKQCMFKKQPLHARIWVMDEEKNPLDLKETFIMKVNFTVINCINGLDGKYYINVYNTVLMDGNLYGKLIFSQVFKKNEVNDVPLEYRNYAETVVIVT